MIGKLANLTLTMALAIAVIPAVGHAQVPGGGGPGGPGGGMRGPQPVQIVTYEAAKQAAEAAETEARNNSWNMTILVVDAAGVPVYLKRMTGASPRTYDFAMGKARAVIESKLASGEYAARVRDGSLAAIADAVALEGGIPILLDNEVVGAVSASGGRPDQDAQVSRAGIAAMEGLLGGD